jgi:2-polyprenyl-3-methyl-5-hydroxy-6-metoxy-1,4-benzoquinol methylase
MTTASDSAFCDPAGTWNRRFAQADHLFGTAPNEWPVQHAAVRRSGARVLCVAGGEGRNSVWPARHGLTVDAFDIAQAGGARARRMAAAPPVRPAGAAQA